MGDEFYMLLPVFLSFECDKYVLNWRMIKILKHLATKDDAINP